MHKKAKEYSRKRFVMFRESDSDNLIFGLNKDYVDNGEKVLSQKEIEEL